MSLPDCPSGCRGDVFPRLAAVMRFLSVLLLLWITGAALRLCSLNSCAWPITPLSAAWRVMTPGGGDQHHVSTSLAVSAQTIPCGEGRPGQISVLHQNEQRALEGTASALNMFPIATSESKKKTLIDWMSCIDFYTVTYSVWCLHEGISCQHKH